MHLNAYILLDQLKIPIRHTSLHSDHLQRPLRSIGFFQAASVPSPHMAILLSPEDLQHHMSDFSSGCFLCPTDQAFDLETCKADVILLEGSASLLDIYEDLNRIFQDFNDLDQELNRLVREEAALNLFGNALLPFVWNPISLYTEDMRLLFYSERKKPQKYQLYFEDELNQYLPDDEIETLKMDKEYNETINAYEPSIFSAAMWGYRILFYNIRNDGIYIARLMILETDRPIRLGDYSLLTYLADFVAYMMGRKKIVLNNHPRFLDESLEACIRGEDTDVNKLDSALGELGWSKEDHFICASVLGSQFDKKFRTASPVAIRIEKTLAQSITLLDGDDIIVLMNLTRSPMDKDQLLQQLVYILREGLMRAGVSREFSPLESIRDFYQQTRIALSMGSKYDPMFWLFRYDNYALKYFTGVLARDQSLEALIPTGLRKLMEYDEINHRNFTESLKIYLRENMHIARTIKKLYMQRATFLYQLKRIQEITELRLDDHQVRLELLIVFEIMDEMQKDR